MKLGIVGQSLLQDTLEEALQYMNELGVDALELGCGGYPGTRFADAEKLVRKPDEVKKLKDLLAKHRVTVSALSVHGNPVHPNAARAKRYREQFEAAVKLAPMLGVDRVITFSGCPGDGPNAVNPNWVTCAWPDEYPEILKYQWDEVLVPYWREAAKFAADNGVKYVALEMHPGFCVYGVESMLRLRDAVGPVVGANFDPSHLVWQGVDPAAAILALRGAVYNFHAKDTKIDKRNTAVNGVLDTKHYGDELHRSWVFRTVGYGCSQEVWREMFSALNLIGYDHVIAIEHEDSLMTGREGLEKAVRFLKENMIYEPKPQGMWWA